MQESDGIFLKIGPCGPDTGNDRNWDDGFHSAIRQIYVYHSVNIVKCIQVAYFDPLKGTVLSPKHGANRPIDFFEEITISPDDFIVLVSGCYSSSYSSQLTSLTFKTASGKTYGPYGIGASDRTVHSPHDSHRERNSFCYKTSRGVRGFHGSADSGGLVSIGIYVQSQASSVS